MKCIKQTIQMCLYCLLYTGEEGCAARAGAVPLQPCRSGDSSLPKRKLEAFARSSGPAALSQQASTVGAGIRAGALTQGAVARVQAPSTASLGRTAQAAASRLPRPARHPGCARPGCRRCAFGRARWARAAARLPACIAAAVEGLQLLHGLGGPGTVSFWQYRSGSEQARTAACLADR